MTIPHWQLMHDCWMEDFRFWYDHREFILGLIRKHPEDHMSESFKDMLKSTDGMIKTLRRQYKGIYGQYPKRGMIDGV